MATLFGLKILSRFKVTILGLTLRNHGQSRGRLKRYVSEFNVSSKQTRNGYGVKA